MPHITLYFAPASRAFTPRWLLEEIGLPYEVRMIDLRKGEQKSPPTCESLRGAGDMASRLHVLIGPGGGAAD
jgi:hypothetical protein